MATASIGYIDERLNQEKGFLYIFWEIIKL
jgi:hypothetical protein